MSISFHFIPLQFFQSHTSVTKSSQQLRISRQDVRTHFQAWGIPP